MIEIFRDVRGGERSRFRFFFTLSALLGAAQVVGIAGSEALFLGTFGVELLPHTFVAAAVFTVLGSGLYASVVGRRRNDRLFEHMLQISALVLLALTPGVALGVTWVLPLLICLYWVNYAVFLNHYWTFAGDYFDVLASKRLFPLFTVGASLGSIGGGLLTAAAGRAAPPFVLIALWAACLMAAALLLRRNRRALRRWGPLALEEADDTSLQGIQGAAHLVRHTPIGRWLAVSAVAMVLSLFVLQYLYSEVFAERFPSAEELAFFFGVYLVVTNVLEVAVEVWITPFVIRRLGVASANLIHPVLTLLSFGLLAVDYRLGAAAVARANREMIENAMAGPVRNLVYNALPASVRGPARAFLEGILVYSGMAVAGTVLILLAGRVSPVWLCAVGGGIAMLYLGANLGVRRQYLRTLVSELRAGRIDLDALSGELGRWELARIAELWETMLATQDDRAASLASQLAPQLAARGAVRSLRAGLDHDDPAVRRACVAALGDAPATEGDDALLVALEDEDAHVRLAAVEAMPAAALSRSQAVALRRRLSDADADVRAAAATHLGDEGTAALIAMLDEDDAAAVCAAVERLSGDALEKAVALLDRSEAPILAAVLAAAADRLAPEHLDLALLASLAEHPAAEVRAGAIRCLSNRSEPAVPEILARRLEDLAREVRLAAATGLGHRGAHGLAAAEPYLRSDLTRAAEGAIVAFACSNAPEAAERLRRELAHRVRQSWRALVCRELLGDPGPGTGPRFLRHAVADALVRDWGLAFFVLEHTEDHAVMRSVEKALRFSAARSRGNALEVLSNLGDRETARLMVLLAEPGPAEDKLGQLGESVEVPGNAAEAEALARRSPNRWIRASFQLEEAEPRERERLEDLMEKLLALKQVPLFGHFSLEQLEAILRVTHERTHHAGETILREGDPGGELYVVLHGCVRVWRNHGSSQALDLGAMSDGSYFGEMAVFDDMPRSATIVAEEETRVLSLAGERLKDFVMQTPEMAFQIFSVLTTRIREVEQRLEQAVHPR